MFAVLADLLDLVLPVTCSGCGAERVALCLACQAALAGPVIRAPLAAPPCWAAGPYDGVLRELILEYKERQRHQLADPLGRALARVIGSSLLGPVIRRPGGPPGEPVVLVPVPSTRAASVARGGDHLRRLALYAARELRRSGTCSAVLPTLRVVRRRRDSVGLDAAARRRNVAGSIGVLSRSRVLPARVVLLDDLVTTGATLTEATRVLAAVQVQVVAAAVLATTERRHGTAFSSGTTAASYVKIP